MKTTITLLAFFLSIASFGQVKDKELDQVKFETKTSESGITMDGFSMNGQFIGPTRSVYPDGKLVYTYYNAEGLAEGFQLGEIPYTGEQVLQEMKDDKVHGNAFKITGNQLDYAQSYKNGKINKVMEVPYIAKTSNRDRCIGNCVNGFGLYAAQDEQFIMGYFWAEHPQTPVIHTFKGGEQYKGAMNKWEREGFGKFQWNDGGYYVGMWKSNKRDGLGIWYNKDGSIRRQGFFKKDELIKSL